LISAALQEFPHIRVVLLIDDPPEPTDAQAKASLAGCRDLPREINELLREPRERFRITEEQLGDRRGFASPEQIRDLAQQYRWAAQWLRDQAAFYPATTTADEFVADEVLKGLAEDFELVERALLAAQEQGARVRSARVIQLRKRLAWTFDAHVSSFERKAFMSLSHEANKAMNLNAYIGLMGRSFVLDDTPKGTIMTPYDVAPDITVPDSDYVLTLDADSVLLRDYCLRLVYFLEEPGNERVAVVQTPYSAFRGAHTRLERMAGATTDIQHLVHQGLTYFDATFWVGANAVIRKSALDDILEVSYEHGRETRRYIQDRTVIEDTESSIDLVDKSWTLHNYNERLSYSATPPDFGSLVIQRGRWANGGLLILPKFWAYMRRRRRAGRRVLWGEVTLRFNYMASIAWASVGLVALLVLPFNSRLLSPVIFLAALPYFLALASDFHRLGYKRTDVFRMYGFNLILLPVNLAGVFKSLQQAASKSKIAFARTPKVKDRTAAPATYIIAAYAIAVFSFYTFARQIVLGNTTNAVFAGFNAVLTTYAIVAYIGVRNSITDIVLGALQWVRVPTKQARAQQAAIAAERAEALDWEAVLYFGPGDDRRSRQVAHWDELPVRWSGDERRNGDHNGDDQRSAVVPSQDRR
jgi:cellulose synthase/poly-beta-1,6-N-acetylglucosamine synthase-like glycosyltransferase